ncbi:hypothetical protein Poli38472_004069 [Pythium oligandrum]|uniref:Carboxypeptidase n=1 Tax=Pythium oligandrum TaxID=41045 RepID=A0A8K1CNF1_PYTOL|nr:hypothetical protein Poli38472_004069 [Pythium oligandrum]|eukprot:TMW66304.1 hypothetical protein Poli38472_004069 [Pythium oligandrum]
MAPTEGTPLNPSNPSRHPSKRKTRVAVLIGTVIAAAAVIGLWSAGKADQAVTTTTSSPPVSGVFCDVTKQDAGYINLPNKKDDHYFYWYFESRSNPTTDPFVIWLTGGPGTSSIMALLAENGPCKVNDNLTTSINPYSWTSNANVLWLDQPTNVGFSYSTAAEDDDHDQDDVGENFYAFLQGFLDKHPELEGRPLFITGESYAGHYIPAVSHKIWQESKKNTTASARINLEGIAIGNGLTNPKIQVAHVLDMVDNEYNITLMDGEEYERAKDHLQKCLKVGEAYLTNGTIPDPDYALEVCDILIPPFKNARRNPYDIRLPCPNVEENSDCYDITAITEFLNQDYVKKELNAPSNIQWQESNENVNHAFTGSGDFVRSYDGYVADLLDDSDIRVLLYVGDADTMCNWFGVKAWATAMDWKHKDEINAAIEHPFLTSDGSVNAGTVSAYKNQLTLLRLFNAGHMVPRDQPAVSLEMLNRFISGEHF